MNREALLDLVAYAGIPDGTRLVRCAGAESLADVHVNLELTNDHGFWIPHAQELRARLERITISDVSVGLSAWENVQCRTTVEEFYDEEGDEPHSDDGGLRGHKLRTLDEISLAR